MLAKELQAQSLGVVVTPVKVDQVKRADSPASSPSGSPMSVSPNGSRDGSREGSPKGGSPKEASPMTSSLVTLPDVAVLAANVNKLSLESKSGRGDEVVEDEETPMIEMVKKGDFTSLQETVTEMRKAVA